MKTMTESIRSILKVESNLLEILYHRNKNQHHSASWFRYLKLLRSCVNRILAVDASSAILCAPEPRKRYQKDSDKALNKQCLIFLERKTAMQIAFSQIIGTGQYVSLGMILLGVLARIWKIVSEITPDSQNLHSASGEHASEAERMETPPIHDPARNDIGIVLERDSSSFEAPKTTSLLLASPDTSTAPPRRRKENANRSENTSHRTTTVGKQDKEMSSQNKRKKRKVRQVDEIDSIFG